MRKKLKQLMGILLSLALVLGLMPGMNLTVRAATDTYTTLMNSATVVKFNGYDWYIIEDNSTSATEGTVTLLAANNAFGTSAFSDSNSNAYSGSKVQGALESLTAENGDFAGVANAIADTDLGDVGVTGAKLYLLSTSEAQNLQSLPDKILKYNFPETDDGMGGWWLRSTGSLDGAAACVFGEYGDVDGTGYFVDNKLGVRPALKLNLSSVIFSSEPKEFTVGSAKETQTITASEVTATYGDTDKSVSASVTTPASGGGAISYTVKDGSVDYIDVASDGKLTIKKVPASGKAYVIVKAAETDDYAETTKEVTVTISKAEATVTAKNQSIMVGGTVPDLSAPVLNTHYSVTGLVGTDALTTAPTLAYQKDGSAVTPDSATAGTYDIVPSGASAGDNYDISYTNGTLTITAKDVQTITASDVTATYGETDKSVSATTDGNGEIRYAVKAGSEDYISVASDGKLTIKKVPADGKAYVTVTASETNTGGTVGNGYAAATKDVTVNISKATVTITAKDQSIYVGGTVSTLSGADFYTVTGLVGEDTLTTAPTLAYQKDGSAATPDNTTAGTYDIVASGASAGDNYNISYTNGTLTISEKQPAKVTKAPEAKTLTYNGSAQELVTAGEATGGTMYYAVTTENTAPTDENLYTTSIPTAINAGTYYVWYKVVGDENHKDTEPVYVTVTLKQAAPSIETEVNTSEGAPAIKVDNLDKTLAEKLLTDEEKEAYENGTPVLVYLDEKVVDKNDVPAEDMTVIEKTLDDAGYTYGVCLDLSLWKKLGDNAAVQIHDTNGNPIKITVSIPETLKNVPEGYTRTYQIVRVHDGVATVLAEGTGDTLTISSDKFSSYFIIFKDVKNSTDDKKQDTPKAEVTNTDNANKDNKISTGDKMNIGIIIMLMVDSAMAALYLTLRKKMIK